MSDISVSPFLANDDDVGRLVVADVALYFRELLLALDAVAPVKQVEAGEDVGDRLGRARRVIDRSCHARGAVQQPGPGVEDLGACADLRALGDWGLAHACDPLGEGRALDGGEG